MSKYKESQQDDVLGAAYMDYSIRHKNEQIIVESSVAPMEHLPVSYFFRTYEDMPGIEKEALSLCRGKVLDVGGGAGCHALELEKMGLEVKAIDISPLAVEVMKERGVKCVECKDVFGMKSEKFDTVLMLMNGIGIVKSIKGLDLFFNHVKSLLNKGGVLLVESTDISYLMQDEEGNIACNLSNAYWGEVTYKLSYKDIKGHPFQWLYVDYLTLKEGALNNGFVTELLKEEEDGNYLCRLHLS